MNGYSTVVFLCITLASASCLAAQEVRLKDHLGADGTLELPPDFEGSLTTDGMFLVSGENGQLRFTGTAGDTRDLEGSWSRIGGLAEGCNGPVLAVTKGAAGELYLGGRFTLCADTPANNVVRYDPVTGAFEPLGTDHANGVSNAVNAIVQIGNDVYVGGEFRSAGGTNVFDRINANHVARFDGSNWHSLGEQFSNGVDSFVLDMSEHDGDLIVAGRFLEAGELAANAIARWDGTGWYTLGDGADNGVQGPGVTDITSIQSMNDVLYVGGFFDQAGGQPAANIAVWNGSVWSSLGSGVNDRVRQIGQFDGGLVVSGQFDTAGGVLASGIASWDGVSWATLGGGLSDFAIVTSIVVRNNELIVGGLFSAAGGQSIENIAVWDGTDWGALEQPMDAYVESLFVDAERLYLGGYTKSDIGGPFNHFGFYANNEWQSVDAPASSLSEGIFGTVHAITVRGSDVFIAGDFKHAGDILANSIVRWNGTTWSRLGSEAENGVEHSNFQLTGQIFAMEFVGDDLYVGGSFTHAGGISAKSIAYWDDVSWNALIEGSANGVNGGGVLALEEHAGDLYVGGSFNQAGEQVANHIARWDGTNWHSLGAGIENGLNDDVLAITTADNGDLYVGGRFDSAGSGAANHIARWDGTAWQSVGSGAENGLDGSASAIALRDGEVFVAGGFDFAGTTFAPRIAKWDGSNWKALEGHLPGFNAGATSMHFVNDRLYIGGGFNQVGNFVIRWDGTNWCRLGIGESNGVSNASVRALASSTGGRLHLGGSFVAAGGGTSLGYAVFTPSVIHADGFSGVECR
jgi:hypothetical protein